MEYAELNESPNSSKNFRLFTFLVIVGQLLGLVAVITTAIWLGRYHGGFAWQENPKIQFNYHPVFMVIGLIFLYGNSIIVYRVFRNARKIRVKILHAFLHLMALLFAAVGLKAAFDSHNLPAKKIPNMYTLHSWVGMAAVVLFGCQYLIALVLFLVPGISQNIKKFYMSHHVFWGLAIFCMGTVAAISGILEKAHWAVKGYGSFVPETYLVNLLGLVIVAFTILIAYIATNQNWKRIESPENYAINHS